MVTAGDEGKAILSRIIGEGARSGDFPSSLAEEGPLALSTFVAWSAVHGLTMLVIDNLTGIPRFRSGCDRGSAPDTAKRLEAWRAAWLTT